MVPGHVTYSVEIKKVKYVTEAGVKFPATALVKFQVDGKEQPWVELMGYVGMKEIYKAIDNGEDLNLDYCYLDRYQIARRLSDLEKIGSIQKGPMRKCRMGNRVAATWIPRNRYDSHPTNA